MIFKRKLLFYATNQLRAVSSWKMLDWYSKIVPPRVLPPPYRHVIQIGDPRLRFTAETVPVDSINSTEIQDLIHCMKLVFKEFKCVGLSAPQVGIAVRVIMFEFSRASAKIFSEEEIQRKQMSYVPFTIVINPEIKITDFNKVAFPETCESIRGFSGEVPRYKGLQLNGLNERGEEVNLQANGWLARVIQHELDHLNGKLYTDTMDRKSFTCTCWDVVNERRGRVILPFRPGS